MADRKISELAQLTAPADGDYVEIIDASVSADADKNKRLTLSRLKTFLGVGRIPADNPGNNKVWKTDGSGTPGWRDDATGGSSTLADGSVTTAKLANDAVTSAKIQDTLLANMVNVGRQGTVDYMTGDTGGDVDFTRDGTGTSADLRGTIRANAVGTSKLAAAVRTVLGRVPTATTSSDRGKVWKVPTGSDTPEWLDDATAAGGSGLSAVSVQAELEGDGTSGDPIGIKAAGVTAAMLAANVIPARAGAFTQADETKLDGIEAGAQVNVGVEFTTADHSKLDGIEAGAQANVGVEFTTADNSKLDGIAAGAEVNPTDAEIGDKAFSNPPSDLSSAEQTAVRTAIGAGTGSGGTGTPVAVANPQELTAGTSTLQVGGATLGTEMADNVSVTIPITALGAGGLASGLSSNQFTLKAGAYLIFVHMDEIWNTTSSSNALQYRSTVALEITGTLPAGTIHDPMPHYFRGAIQSDPGEAAAQAYVYLPADTQVGLALVSYPGIGEDSGSSKNLNYHCTIDQVHIFPMGGVKGDKGDPGSGGGGGTDVAAHTPADGDDELAGVDIGGTDYEIVDRQGRDRLHAVEQRVHPIREVPQTWADVSDGTAGWTAPAGLLTTVGAVAALTFANTARTGTSAQFVYVRIPVGAIQSSYRFAYAITGGSEAGETHNRVLGTWSGERVGSDSSWQYYRIGFYEGSGFSGGKLQFGGSDLFEWEGTLTRNAVEDQLEAIGVPQAINALKNVTRDLHLDGATRLVKNSAAATAAVARVAIANSSLQGIEAGTAI